MADYVIYGYTLSYFTRKVEVAFELQGLSHIRRHKSLFHKPWVERLGGTHQVPVVRAPGLKFMADSTLIIEATDAVAPKRRLFPSGEAGILARLVEEWLDEWLSRSVIHYRWNYDECAAEAAKMLGQEILPGFPSALQDKVGRSIANWGKRAVRALAVDQPSRQRAAESVCERMFVALDAQLAKTAYAMGDRATVVDAVLLGALRAHLNFDPVPRRALQRHPRILEWLANPRPDVSDGELCTLEHPNGFARFVLDEMVGDYRGFILANAEALRAGQKAFVADLGDGSYSYLALPYPQKSRTMTSAKLFELAGDDAQRLQNWLSANGLAEIFVQP